MDSYPDIVWKLIPIFAAVVGAFVAAFTSLVVTMLSKEQKISEFRQAWIDALRNDIAEFISSNLLVITHGREISPEKRFSVLLKDRAKELIQIELLAARIKMRLNYKEEDHVCLANKITELMEFGDAQLRDNFKNKDELINQIIEISQKILKDNWNLVKRGEILFACLKYGSWGAVILLILFMIAYYNDHFKIEYVF